ncbi:hypothetical protein PoB_001118900 [Plakobranchus ocellatus]|uniref:Uncharacterized protein n=1 Tax=Plakobranchus ocellatus TaxID=259542 RepID=A0AAV3YRT7_9GAST|nr:hypothetical protein PoB_001118900 [Plakobranchus ocellatus]
MVKHYQIRDHEAVGGTVARDIALNSAGTFNVEVSNSFPKSSPETIQSLNDVFANDSALSSCITRQIALDDEWLCLKTDMRRIGVCGGKGISDLKERRREKKETVSL